MGSYDDRVIHVAPTPGPGGAPSRTRINRGLLVKAVALVLAALATWLVWRAYQQPEMLLELGNLMLLC